MPDLDLVLHTPDGANYPIHVPPQMAARSFIVDVLIALKYAENGTVDPDKWRVGELESLKVLDPQKTLDQNGIRSGQHLYIQPIPLATAPPPDLSTAPPRVQVDHAPPPSKPSQVVPITPEDFAKAKKDAAKAAGERERTPEVRENYRVPLWMWSSVAAAATLIVGGVLGYWIGLHGSDQARTEVAQLRANEAVARQELAAARTERDNLGNQLKQINNQLDSDTRTSVDLSTKLNDAQRTIAALNQAAAAAKKREQDSKTAMDRLQQIANEAQQAVSAQQSEHATLRNQLQRAQQQIADNNNFIAQKDEIIRELRTRLTTDNEAARQNRSTPLTESIRKGDRGTLVWYGPVNGSRDITIDRGKVDSGRVLGSLPRKPCRLEISGSRVDILTQPSQTNGWNYVKFRVDAPNFGVVRIDWTVR